MTILNELPQVPEGAKIYIARNGKVWQRTLSGVTEIIRRPRIKWLPVHVSLVLIKQQGFEYYAAEVPLGVETYLVQVNME